MTRAKDISKIVTDANLSGTLDVTGTVTAGGLTVEKSAAVGATFNRLTSSGHTIDVQVVGNTVGSLGSDVGGQGMFNIDAVTAGVSSGKILLTTNDVRRQLIDNNGDISFYEDTGTTPKLFWDASAESLGIGTSSPSKRLHLYATNDAASVRFENTASAKVWDITPARPNVANTGLSIYNVTDDRTDVHIDNNGNVGIGTSSPTYQLDVTSSGGSSYAMWHNSTTGSGASNGFLVGASGNDATIWNYENATMQFATNNLERMRIDANGHVTMPYQSAFLAKLSTAQTNITPTTIANVVAFDTEIFDQNADFDTTLNRFTAPVTGKYQINATVRLADLDTGASYYYMDFDSSNRDIQHIIDIDRFSADLTDFSFTMSQLIDMDAGDTVRVRIVQQGGTQQTDINAESYFSGYLVA